MTSTVPVPQFVAGIPVVAAIAVQARPSELPCEFIVICQQDRTPPGTGPYVTWRVGTRDGHQWTAEHARGDLTWPQAVACFASRASLPEPIGPPHRQDAARKTRPGRAARRLKDERSCEYFQFLIFSSLFDHAFDLGGRVGRVSPTQRAAG